MRTRWTTPGIPSLALGSGWFVNRGALACLGRESLSGNLGNGQRRDGVRRVSPCRNLRRRRQDEDLFDARRYRTGRVPVRTYGQGRAAQTALCGRMARALRRGSPPASVGTSQRGGLI